MMYVNPIKLNNYYLSKKNISFKQDATNNITTSKPTSLKTKEEPKFHDEFKASASTQAQRNILSKVGKAVKALFVPKDMNDPLNLEYSIFKF